MEVLAASKESDDNIVVPESDKPDIAQLTTAILQAKAEQNTVGSFLLQLLEKNTRHNQSLDKLKYGLLGGAFAGIIILQMIGKYTAEVGTIIGILIGHLFTKKSD